ncbi:energy transducer TonB [Sphingomonas elodea]|uniref:energy transducer TonB n=1 Tax=Sphingomonas elodea TaxID=179878 RepID=UPI0002631D57|nr:energy transducer TonB [Sphingomonas elodea]
MHADSRYHASAPRSVSFGAALAINGAILAGMIFAAPNIVVLRDPETVMQPIDIREIPPPPPIDEPKPVEKIQPRTSQPPFADKPIVETTSETSIRTTTILPDTLPPIAKPADTGPVTVLDPPKAVPALIGATTDPRYAQDFQPEYPSQEIRAQRDGLVTLRVLIGTDGRVKAVEPVSATSDAFFAVTKRQALGKWRFRAATRGGVPEESWKTMTVRFRIEDAR